MRSAHESRAGEVLNQRYELHEPIRATAESEVYRATDRKSHRGVHVALLRAEHALKPSVAARFVRTPKQLLTLRHPNVLRVLAVESDDTGIPFVVEESLDGELLSLVLARFPGGMSVEDAMPVLWPVAEAIAAAHHVGLIHGQLGPEHVLLARVGAGTVPKVRFDGTSPGAADDAWPRAPELRTGAAVADPRSDVWALGALAYALLSGRAPSLNDGQRVALRTCAPHVPGELGDLVERCLTSEIERRPATAREVSGALSSLRVRMRVAGAAEPAAPPPSLATPVPVAATPLRTLAWNASGGRELALIAPTDASEVWGPDEGDFDEALDALFDAGSEAERGAASAGADGGAETEAEPEADRDPNAEADAFASSADGLEFSFESPPDPADVDADPEQAALPPGELDYAALPDLAALPALVAREASSPPAKRPSAVASQRAIAKPPPPAPPASAVTPANAAAVAPAARAPKPAPSKKSARVTDKRKATASARAKAPTTTGTPASVRARDHAPRPSGGDWFRTGPSGRAPARVVGSALATARASLFPPPATPVEKETRRMRQVARRGERSYGSALGSFVFLLFAVSLVFAVPLLADPTRGKAGVLLGDHLQAGVAAFAAITIVALVRTWTLQTAERPPMLRPVTTLLKPLTLILCLLCATYFLPPRALGPVERAARAFLPWLASGFYLFLALHGLVLAAREAASSVPYALLLAVLHVGGFYGSFQVLAVTVLEKPAGAGAESGGFFARFTGRGSGTDSAPDAGVAPSEMPGTEPASTEPAAAEADELGIDDLQKGRKQQRKQAGKLHGEMQNMTR